MIKIKEKAIPFLFGIKNWLNILFSSRFWRVSGHFYFYFLLRHSAKSYEFRILV